jgi:hypothetical protein
MVWIAQKATVSEHPCQIWFLENLEQTKPDLYSVPHARRGEIEERSGEENRVVPVEPARDDSMQPASDSIVQVEAQPAWLQASPCFLRTSLSPPQRHMSMTG